MMRYLIYIPLLAALALSACSAANEASRVTEESPGSATTAPYYTSAFPDTDVSENISEIQESVVRITATGFYRSYLLSDSNITRDQLQDIDLGSSSAETMQTEESTAGTAIVMAKNSRRALLLTCAHVVHYPDTVVKYRKEEGLPENTFVESVTIKQRQTNFALNLPALKNFEILAMDHSKDLALLEINLNTREDRVNSKPLQLTMGNSRNLRLASLVYVLGYPKGYPMVTRGIVSDPDRTGAGDFVTDALFNRGISGGLIIASKDDFESFEWVGMASSSAANNEFTVVPDEKKIDAGERLQPYEGDLFVEKRSYLAYGITQAIPTNKILSFLDEHQDKIRGVRLNIDYSQF